MNSQSSAQPVSHPPRQPLLWAAAAFAVGIFTGFYIWRPPLWWLVSALTFIIFAIFFLRRRPRAAWTLVLAALFLAGALVIGMHSPDDDAGVLAFADGGEATITAHVIKEGSLRQAASSGERPDGQRQVVDLETEQVQTEDGWLEVRSRIRLSIFAKDTPAQSGGGTRLLHYGDRIRFFATLSRPHNYGNPGAFDYRGYLAQKEIVALASAKAVNVELLPGFVGSRAELWRTRIYRSIIEKIGGLWTPAEAALIDAMVIGEDAFIERDTRADFQRSGTYHVLVVSGMNVGILAFLVFWVLRRLRANDLIAGVLTVLLSVAYALLTDVGAPIWRATLMLALYLAARLLYRDRAMLNAIGGAALGLLMVDPRALFGASFQLTFLSVLLIAAVGVPILERTSQPFHRGLSHLDSLSYDVHLAPRVVQFRLDLRMIAGRLQGFVGERVALPALAAGARMTFGGCEILVISAVMQLGLALPMAYYFHRATVVGLPANMLVVPLTGILMPASVLAIAAGYVSPFLARAPAWIAGITLDAIAGTVRELGGLRIADARVATPEFVVLLCSVVALLAAMALARRRFWYALSGMLLLAASAFWVSFVSPRPQIVPGVLEVTAIDVGQGDSILLVLPQGQTVLVDAGGLPHWMHSDFDVGENVVSPYLWSRGIAHLDAVVVTHAHADHLGGMGAVLANFRPKELWIGVDTPTPDLEKLLHEANDLGISVVQRRAGDEFQRGGVDIRILAPTPDPGSRAWQPNDDCLVMKITYGGTSALLEADAPPQAEWRIAGEHPEADLLKVAHHGSATSTIPRLLAAVHPRFAVISVGPRNVYGHPRKEVLARLAKSAVATYRTDLNGAVSFYLDGHQTRATVAALR